MKRERDPSQPDLEHEPVKPTHIRAKGIGEVAEDTIGLFEDTPDEFKDQVLITVVSKDNLSLLEGEPGKDLEEKKQFLGVRHPREAAGGEVKLENWTKHSDESF